MELCWRLSAALFLLAAMGCPKPEPQPPMLPGIFEANLLEKPSMNRELQRHQEQADALSPLLKDALKIRKAALLKSTQSTSEIVILARSEDIEASGLDNRLLGMDLRPSPDVEPGRCVASR